ncbi:MAG: ECF-type sigma factor [Planctomycetota bacterium]
MSSPFAGRNFSKKLVAKLPENVVERLERAKKGDAEALEEVIPHIYELLRELAKRRFAGKKGTLCTTDLLHETYVKVFKPGTKAWVNEYHFIGVASLAMRHVLVDYWKKRSRRGNPSPIDSILADYEEEAGDLEALDLALKKLEESEPSLAELVQLRFFGKMQWDDIAQYYDVSKSTVERDWRFARAWLRGQMTK